MRNRQLKKSMILCAAVFFVASLSTAPAAAQQEFPSCILGEEILDMPIVTATGEDVGEIEDVIFNREGKIQNFIVEYGGFLDIGDREVVIDTDELRYDAEGDVAVFQGTRADLEAKQDIDDYRYARGYGYGGYGPGYHPYRPYHRYGYYSPYYRGGAYDPYRRPSYGPRAYYGPEYERDYHDMSRDDMRRDEMMQRDMQAREMQRRRDMEQKRQYQAMREEEQRRMDEQARYNPLLDPDNISMDDIIDANVGNRYGEIVGELENLIINNRGNISHAIIEVGGFLGIGDKRVTVPFNELRSVGPYFVIYPGTEKHLESFPAFEMAQMTGEVPKWCVYQREQGEQTRQQQDRQTGGQTQGSENQGQTQQQ